MKPAVSLENKSKPLACLSLTSTPNSQKLVFQQEDCVPHYFLQIPATVTS